MKIMVVTTPLRPVPTGYPPMGSLSVVHYLREHGFEDVEFYNIDSNRPSYGEALQHIIDQKPDILGISAVVSTAYDYTKQLSCDVKRALPDTLVVVGGNLAASAEILLRKTGTDICVIGEGEKTFFNIARRAVETREPAAFRDIPGLVLLDAADGLINTGYEAALPPEELYEFDWKDLSESSDISRFIYDPYESDQALSWLVHDPRAQDSHRRGKKVVEIHAAKGCVARCTFCHRFEKGVRYIPVDVLRKRIRTLVDEYEVGYLVIADENFGTDRKWLAQFCEMIKEFDLLWRVAGMRVNCISPENVLQMKAAGCVSIVYGMETGSARMLEIMEKKTKVEQNYDAMSWTIGNGLYSIIQLVVGMPGESPDTIRETIEFCKISLTLSPTQNPNNLSINYAQALPGTPLYEFARHKGMIGNDLDSEEEYLLRISDKNAHDEHSQLNFTDYPILETHTWRPLITIETNYAFVKKYGLDHYRRILLNDTNYFRKSRSDNGRFANPQRLIDVSIATDSVHGVRERLSLDSEARLPSFLSLLRKRNFGMAIICYPVWAYRVRALLPLLVMLKDLREMPFATSMRTLTDYLVFKLFRQHKGSIPVYKSLRRIVWNDFGSLSGDSAEMEPLRKGR